MSHSDDPSGNNLPINIIETFPLPVFTQTTFPRPILPRPILPSNDMFSSIIRASDQTLDLQWDNFIQSSINELIPSNNQGTTFNIRNSAPINTVENTPISTLDHILQQSFADSNQNLYKKIISKEGEKQITHEHYDPTIHKVNSCPITQNNFNIGQAIAILPCGHIFELEAINHWLLNEKANCPVCRYKLKSKEVRIEVPDSSGIFTEHNISFPDLTPSVSDGRQRLLNSLNIIYQPLQNIHTDFSNLPIAPTIIPPSTTAPLPTAASLPIAAHATMREALPISTLGQTFIHQLFSNEIERAEEADLQQAIIASLVEMQMTEESDNEESDNDIVMEDADSEVSSLGNILSEPCEDNAVSAGNDEEISPD